VIAFTDFYFYIFQGALIIMESGKKQFMKLFLAALSLAFAFVFCSSSAMAANNHPIVKVTKLKTGQTLKMTDWTGGHREYYQIEEIASSINNRNAPIIAGLKTFSDLSAAKKEAYDYAASAPKNISKTALIFHPYPGNKDGQIYEVVVNAGMGPMIMPGSIMNMYAHRWQEMYQATH
jgi:hypothetical protein